MKTRVSLRKEMRKQNRRNKKASKHTHRAGNQPTVEVPEKLKSMPPVTKQSFKKKKKKKETSVQDVRKKQLMTDNKMEEKNIKRLAKQLKLNKRKSKSMPKSFVDDGLDYILEACESDRLKQSYGIDQDASELIKDDKLKSSENERMGSDSEFEGDDVEFGSGSDFDDTFDFNSENEVEEDEDKMSVGEEEEEEREADEESALESEDNDDTVLAEVESKVSKPTAEKLKEDIYGRLRDKQGNVVKTDAKYVVPSKRNATQETEKLSRLKKLLKGLFNRLSEANVQSIALQVEELYRFHSRNDMNETIVELLTEALIQPYLTPERLVQEHAMLIAMLHAHVGSEIGAHILQSFVTQFHDLYADKKSEEKEIFNVLLFICHLYSFKVTSCLLLFDILHLLIDGFSDLEVELLLLMLKSVGFQMRKDDPKSLKEKILILQTKARSVPEHEDSRIRFMLETIIAIRNNNVSKILNYDPSHMEHLKKLLRGILRKGSALTELRVSLKDLLDVEKKGRWWLVGSAWENELSKDESTADNTVVVPEESDDKILMVAKKQRMNTAVRKKIFCILMGAEDYLDCFEKLMRLGLKNQQEREIVIVIIDCCLQEKTFNPFYAFLTEKLCSFDRKYQMIVQCTLWDHFKELRTMNNTKITNLARFLSHLLLSQKLSLSVLKVLQFSEMDKNLLKFLRKTLHSLFLAEREDVQRTFSRICDSNKFRVLRESLRLFAKHFVMKVQKDVPADIQEKLKDRLELVDNLLQLSSNS